jgi:hypothetical protein
MENKDDDDDDEKIELFLKEGTAEFLVTFSGI